MLYHPMLGTLDLRRDCLSLTVEAEKPIGFVTETQMYRCGILNRQCYQWVIVNGQFPLRLSVKATPEVNDEAAYAAERGRSGCPTICFCKKNKILMTNTWKISISENVCLICSEICHLRPFGPGPRVVALGLV